MSDFARALGISPQQLYKYSRENDPWTVGPAMREKLRSVGLLLDVGNNVLYKEQEENGEVLLLREQLKQTTERLDIVEGENEALRRSLSPQVVRIILEAAEKKSDPNGGTNSKRVQRKSAKRSLQQ